MPIPVQGVGLDPVWGPTEDDLPYSGGEPVESWRRFLQLALLPELLRAHRAERLRELGLDEESGEGE